MIRYKCITFYLRNYTAIIHVCTIYNRMRNFHGFFNIFVAPLHIHLKLSNALMRGKICPLKLYLIKYAFFSHFLSNTPTLIFIITTLLHTSVNEQYFYIFLLHSTKDLLNIEISFRNNHGNFSSTVFVSW